MNPKNSGRHWPAAGAFARLLMIFSLLTASFGMTAPASAQVDTIARGLALQAGQQSNNLSARGLGNVGTHIWLGRTAYTGSIATGGIGSATTYAVETVPMGCTSFAAVRMILGVGNDAAGDAGTPSVQATVAVTPDLTDASLKAQPGISMTFTVGGVAGTAVTTLPPTTGALPSTPANSRTSYTFSDWTPITSVNRTDVVGARPIVVLYAMLYQNTGSAMNVVFSGGADNFDNLATPRPDGNFWRMFSRFGGYYGTSVTNSEYPGNSVAIEGTPIAGWQYICTSGKVITVLSDGDSRDEGRGTQISWGPVAEAVSNLNATAPIGIHYEVENFGWAGQPSPTFAERLLDFSMNIDKSAYPQVVSVASFTPNDGNGVLTAGTISGALASTGVALAAAARMGSAAYIHTGYATDSSVRAYGSSDTLRVNYAAYIKALSARGFATSDHAALIDGLTDGTGQKQIAAAYDKDGQHINTAGNVLLGKQDAAVIRKLIPLSPTISANTAP